MTNSLRTIGRWLGRGVLGLLAVVILAFLAIQTPPGKSVLASLASSLASSDGLRVEVSGIGGFVPSDMEIGTINVADTDGVFAEIDGLSLSWSPLALVFGTLDIESAGAKRIALSRKPNLPPSPAAAESGEGGGLALPVRVGRFAIDEITIAEPVVGHAAVLSLVASAELRSLARGLSLDFDLTRRDQPGRVEGRLHYVPETASLDLDVTAEEPAGGLAARAAGLADLPALVATLKGTGPLDNWDGHLDVSGGDVARVTGAAGIRAVTGGRKVNLAIDADVARLLPATLAPLFEGRTELAATATISDALQIAIETGTLRAAGFGAGAKGRVDAEAMTGDLSFGVTLGEAARFSTLAPGAQWGALTLDGTLKGLLKAPNIVAQISARDLKGAGYGAGTVAAKLTTLADAGHNLSLNLDGQIDGLTAQDPKVAASLGQTARLRITGSRPETGLPSLTGLTVQLTALTTHFVGTASTDRIDGTFTLENLDLTAFSPLAGRALKGKASLTSKIAASGDLSRVDLTLNGGTQGVSTGIASVDGLVGGATTLSGELARDGENAISIKDLVFAAEGLSIRADGGIARSGADLVAKIALTDIGRLDPRVSGALNGDANFSGTLEKLDVKAKLQIPSGTAMKQPIQGLSIAVDAQDLTGKLAAELKLAGNVAGKAATGSGRFATLADGAKQVKGLVLAVGSIAAKGDVDLAATGLATGAVTVSAGNLNDISALALMPLAGSLNADIRLDVAGGKQRAAIKANADKVVADTTAVGRARIDATLTDFSAIPMLDGSVLLSGVKAGGMDIPKVELTAAGNANGTSVKLDTALNGATLAANGVLSQRDSLTRFRLDRLAIARGGASLTSAAPANFSWSNNQLTIDALNLATRGGGVTVSGRAGTELDLDVDIKALPLSLAELAAPGLGLSGTLSGSAKVAGPAAAPNGTYRLDIANLSTPDLATNGVGALAIRADGRLGGGRVTTQAAISGTNLSGVTISGSAPLAAGELDLALKGALDLAIANPMLSTTGARIAGRATIDATVKGTAAAPRAGGTVRIAGARFDDGENGVSLTNIDALISGTERSVTISSLSAKTANGGGLTARGQVGLDPAAGFPGKIDVDLANAGLINSDLMRLVAEGRLAVEGAFANNPRLTGRLVVKSLDVNIADRLPGGIDALNVRHVNGRAAPGSAGKSKAAPAKPTPRPDGAGMPLDLTVSAPNNVFVRGMGLTAELGGDIKVNGTSASPVTLGGFEMRRGTFDILGKRLTFTRGKITFSGTTDPDLDFVAETTANDITAQVLVTGPASKPEVTFSSTPTLPQDEVLSRLMFGRSAGSLTAGQAVQVAQTVAQFSGGGAGVMEKMRRSLGVDSLDVGTDAAGTGGQVGIGKRLNDKMYLGVKQGTTPNSSQVTVDIDITKNIRLQGATGADGAAEVGIGAQWDY